MPRPSIDATVAKFSLNLKQELAARIVLDHFTQLMYGDTKPPQLLMAILGEPGVGKSVVASAIDWHMKQHDASNKIIIAAFTGMHCYKYCSVDLPTCLTGKAAVHVNGKTLHSALDISRHFESEGPSKRRKRTTADTVRALQIRWNNVEYLLIDEISTVSAQLFAQTSTQAVNAKGSQDKTLPFGGLNVIVCGDFMQFPPGT